MSIYDSKQGVKRYVEMCNGYDGQELYTVLRKHVPTGNKLLELGSGAGNDAKYLSVHYDFLGSDYSEHFLCHLRETLPELNFIQLDGRKVKLASTVDCIFSNKVLHHLTSEELEQSLKSQYEALNSKGIIAHSFWLGAGREDMDGLTVQYHEPKSLIAIVSKYFNIVETYTYAEFESGDSMLVIAQKAT